MLSHPPAQPRAVVSPQPSFSMCCMYVLCKYSHCPNSRALTPTCTTTCIAAPISQLPSHSMCSYPCPFSSTLIVPTHVLSHPPAPPQAVLPPIKLPSFSMCCMYVLFKYSHCPNSRALSPTCTTTCSAAPISQLPGHSMRCTSHYIYDVQHMSFIKYSNALTHLRHHVQCCPRIPAAQPFCAQQHPHSPTGCHSLPVSQRTHSCSYS